MSVLSPSQDQSFHNCRWAWCHSTFSNNAGLVHHVIQEHVLRAIPVKRRDICMIRRAEEGKGESLELMIDMYSYSSGQSSCHKSVELTQGPSPSLPSPPASSPALHSPQAHLSGPAPSLSSMEKRDRPEPTSSDDISHRNSPLLPSSKPFQKQTPPVNPITFASLSSPEPEQPPFLLEVPDSPSFTALVERPNKRKRTSNLGLVSHNEAHANQLYPPPLSQSSSASFASQNSVEAQLTQTQEPVEDYLRSHLDSHHHLENLPAMSQPPSQLRLDPEFPLHFHDRLQGSTSKARRTGLDPNHPIAAPPLTPSSPVSSPIFAVSTPVRQNWYQPPLKRRKRSVCDDKNSDPSPSKMESFVSPMKMFRSGTLQIKPTSLSEESKAKHINLDALPSGTNRQNNLAARSQSPDDLYSQSSHDSSDPFENNSYPTLQTQAPYQSQILTQL